MADRGDAGGRRAAAGHRSRTGRLLAPGAARGAGRRAGRRVPRGRGGLRRPLPAAGRLTPRTRAGRSSVVQPVTATLRPGRIREETFVSPRPGHVLRPTIPAELAPLREGWVSSVAPPPPRRIPGAR